MDLPWSTTDRIPRVVFALAFGQGGHSGALTDYVLFVGGRAYDATTPTPVAQGTAIDAEPTACYSAEDAAQKWGYGSEIHREAIAWFNKYPGAPAYGVSAAKGGAAVRASKVFTFAGTATASATMTVEIAGTGLDLYVASGTAAATLGPDVEALVLSDTSNPVLADATAGAVTVTAKCYGPGGNSIKVRIYGLPAGITVDVSDATLASGATEHSWSDAYAAAFALDTVFYHVVCSTCTAATLNAGTGNLRGRIKANLDPTVGKLSDVWIGYCGALADAQTLNDGLDLGTTAYDEPSYWFRLAWAKSNYVEPWFLAAQMGGLCAFSESISAVQNWVGLEGGPTLDLIPPTPLVSNYPTDTELNDAIAYGISPCYYVHKSNATKVCTCVTSKHLIGSANDPSYVEHPNITAVCRVVSYGVRSKLSAAYSGFVFVANDEEGGVPDNIGPRQVCPREVVEKLLTIMKQDYQGGPLYYVQNVEAHRAETTAELAASPTGRLLYQLPIDVPRWADQIGGMHREVGR